LIQTRAYKSFRSNTVAYIYNHESKQYAYQNFMLDLRF
jgi:hypothetical protein